MSWQQLRVRVRSDQLEYLEQLLLDYGGLSISYLDAENQPVFQTEPGSTPLWDHIDLLCLFDRDINLDGLRFLLGQHPAVENEADISVEILADQPWERSWMADFSAMQFGKNLWVCPSWQEPPDPSAINIMLDPGLAFGSGSHATTGLCLRWLAKTIREHSVVIDYGCGSGILAIAAALLGANTVIAVDNDPQAITATMDNSRRNQIPDGVIHCFLPEDLPAEISQRKADILIANILAEPLMQLAERFAGLVKTQGQIALSGILEEQSSQLLFRYSKWFNMEEALLEDGWARLSGTRSN